MGPGLEPASALGAPVTVLTVNDDIQEAEDIQQPLRDYPAPDKLKTGLRLDTGNRKEGETILASADEIKAGLTVMGAFTRGPLKEFFFGGVPRTVLGSATCSILMMTWECATIMGVNKRGGDGPLPRPAGERDRVRPLPPHHINWMVCLVAYGNHDGTGYGALLPAGRMRPH